MANFDEIQYCVGCGAEIALSPFMKADQSYCCSDCANGLECHCGVTFEEEEGRQQGDNASFGASSV
ncbi:MAG: hypothetical protein PVI78_10960 [Anaerolineales bacterium]|jgi:hypothetical protein